jgi:hypothetical protein
MTFGANGTGVGHLQEAGAALACSDYRQAIERQLEFLKRLSEQDPGAVNAFRDGPFADLLMAAAEHAVHLAERHHFLAALDLVQFVSPYLATSEGMTRELAGVKQHCVDRALYTRGSPRGCDVLLCCSEADNQELQLTLAALLRDLGVLVAEEPFIASAPSSEADLVERIAATDAVVVLLSRSFFAAAWPQDVLHGLLNRVTPDAAQVLPVWHRISRSEVLTASEPLEKTLGFDTAKSSLAQIAQGIADIARPDLASGALHKLIWAATLNGKVLGEAITSTEFELPIRHETLDEDLIARIRLIRAAFLDGFRHPMASWLDAFSRELEPYSALLEWERLARTFHTLQGIQRGRGASSYPEAVVAQLLPGNLEEDATGRDMFRQALLELAGLSANQLFKLIWMASQPIARHLDVGFSSRLLGFASYFLESGLVVGPTGDDFESEWKPGEDITRFSDWTGQLDTSAGVLHTEEERPWSKPWDLFISHASEDKVSLVRPLAEALEEYGVKVWYDSFNLRPGLSLGRSIDAGIAGAEFGIVVLSPHFIAKEWPRYEFDALCERQTATGAPLIALWHSLAPDDRPAWTHGLDREKSLDTAAQPITALAMRILEWVRPDRARFIQRQLAYTAVQVRQAQGQVPLKDIDPGQIGVAPRRYERLPKALVDRVALVQATLLEVRPNSLTYWIDGFLRDYAPEHQIAFWERYAAMYLEAVCVVDWLQEKSRKGLFQIFKSRTPKVGHSDVNYMLDGLLNSGATQERLSEFRQTYPDDIVDKIAAISQSSTVIEVLG